MPTLPKRPCRKPGCPALVASGFCPQHQYSREASRPSAAKRGYGRRWQRYRLTYIHLHPRCIASDENGRCEACTEEVDHITPVTGPDDPLFWDPTNHQPLCSTHHKRKTAKEDGGFGNRKGGGR